MSLIFGLHLLKKFLRSYALLCLFKTKNGISVLGVPISFVSNRHMLSLSPFVKTVQIFFSILLNFLSFAR